MPVVPMREILDPAFAERYGVAAINIVNDLTLEAVLAAATELESPLIVQTSLKTVKSIGAEPLYALWRARADEVPVPVTLHLDHCPDREWITTCLERAGTRCCSTAPSSTSRRTRARRSRSSPRPTATAPRSRARSRASLGVEDGVGSDEAGEVHPVEVSAEFIEATGVYSFAPGDRHRARPLQGRAEADARARHRDRRAAPDPEGPARRHRADRGAVHRPDRARLREGQHLDRAEDRVHRRAPRVPRRQPRQARPAVAASSTCARRSRRWPRTTSGSSGRPARASATSPRPADACPR